MSWRFLLSHQDNVPSHVPHRIITLFEMINIEDNEAASFRRDADRDLSRKRLPGLDPLALTVGEVGIYYIVGRGLEFLGRYSAKLYFAPRFTASRRAMLIKV